MELETLYTSSETLSKLLELEPNTSLRIYAPNLSNLGIMLLKVELRHLKRDLFDVALYWKSEGLRQT